jgi:hypothetical protein
LHWLPNAGRNRVLAGRGTSPAPLVDVLIRLNEAGVD